MFHANTNQKKAQVAILMSDIVDCEAKALVGQKGTFHNKILNIK